MIPRRDKKVINDQELMANSSTERLKHGRTLLLQAYEAAMAAADPFSMINSGLYLNGSMLVVQGQTFNLDNYRKIFVTGAGKASGLMADAVEQLLGQRITRGYVNVPAAVKGGQLAGVESEIALASRIIRHYSGHPVPDEAGVAGALEILGIAEEAGPDDLIIFLVSGGGSSLLPLPRAPLTLADKQGVTDLLLRCGATISEINTVRKHISAVKGGWLAAKAWPATVIGLVLSDVIGDPLEFIASGPTVPDSTTFEDALAVLDKYSLRGSVSREILQFLISGRNGLIPETLKKGSHVFAKIFNFVIGNNHTVVAAMAKSLQLAGFRVWLNDAPFVGSVEEAGPVIDEAVQRLVASHETEDPLFFLAGGEVTVRVTGGGKGGRNQHLALLMVSRLQGLGNVVFAALGTDGIDGPTDAAGAIVDGNSMARAEALGLEPEDFIRRQDSWHFFSTLGDLVCTGYTGSNVNDLYLAVII